MKLSGVKLCLVTALVGGGLTGLPATGAQAAVVTAELVKTTWTGGAESKWAHPSPDPSGITYNSRTGRLIISDGEVEELEEGGVQFTKNVWMGTNLYVASLQGELLETGADTIAYSQEPAGVGFRPALSADLPERLFVSDDNLDRVFEVDRGKDGSYGTADDTQTSFSTRFTGSRLDDPEDVAVDLELTRNGQLLIIDGYRQEVYLYGPGDNKRFDGLPAAGGDDTVSSFDVAIQGASDPEGVAYNRFRNTLLVLDDPSNQIYEFGLDGKLQNIVKLPFTMKSGAGIALAPPSNGSGGAYNAYIVDRGVDNSNQDLFNDGRLYEITVPGLTGSDGTTTPAPSSGSVDIPVRASTDDAEEKSSGTMSLTSGDLNLGTDGATAMKVGMRFTDVPVPKGATITSAYLQFQADEAQSVPTDLTIRAQTTSAGTFTATSGNVASRTLTTENVRWQPPAWPTIGARAADQRTPNLAGVLQEVVNGSTWASGQALGLVITGTGERTAESYDGGAAKAPVLRIEYGSGSGGGTANQPPVVSAGPDTGGAVSAEVALAGSVTDPEGRPVTAAWTTVNAPAGGTVTYKNAAAASTSATFSAAGDYTLRLTGSDGSLTATDDVLVKVTSSTTSPPSSGSAVLDIPVRAGSDDAEQVSGSSADVTSSDLELVVDGSKVQTVGLRFTGVNIPTGSTITNAYVQFQVDEATTATADLTVAGEAADNPGTFTTAVGDVTGRQKTGRTVSWPADSWPTVGARTAAQRTPNLAPVVQEIVNRQGWASGNAMVMLVTGSGTRTAEAYEGGAAKAPVLHIEYGTSSGGGTTTNTAPVVDAGADQTVVASTGGGTPTPGLPGSLTGVMPEAHGHIGPYRDSNGNLYTVIEDDLAGGNDPMAMKSSDGGATWVEIDRANRTTTGDLESDWAVQVGSRIYFAWQKSSGQVHLAAFNTSDAPTGPDTWAVQLETLYEIGDPADQWTSLSPLGNGDLWAFYSITSSGKTHQAAFRKRSATGTLGTQVVLDPDRTVSQVVAVPGAGDVTHVFYKDHANHQVFYRSLSAAGELGAPVRVDGGGTSTVHAPMTNAVVTQVDGADRVTVAWADGAGVLKAGGVDGNGAVLTVQGLSDVPVVINPGTTGNEGAVAHLVGEGSTVHALYADQATQDIWWDRSAGGGAWGSDVEVADGLQAQWLTGLIAFTNRGGLPVLGFIYDTGPHADDDGMIRYAEHPLGSGSGMSTTLNGSVKDDGLPSNTLGSTWTLVSSDSGGQANFQQPTSPVTSVTFTQPGSYVLRLTADDSAVTGSDEVTVIVA